MFFTEFITSFAFILTWVIIRKHDLGDYEKLGILIKPLLIALAFYSCHIYGILPNSGLATATSDDSNSPGSNVYGNNLNTLSAAFIYLMSHWTLDY